jgi:excisionase family DNA binding protein
MERETPFMPATAAAARLGVPVTWLRAEAEAGRLPHIRIGKRLLFNPSAVERSLSDRASESGKAVADAR